MLSTSSSLPSNAPLHSTVGSSTNRYVFPQSTLLKIRSLPEVDLIEENQVVSLSADLSEACHVQNDVIWVHKTFSLEIYETDLLIP